MILSITLCLVGCYRQLNNPGATPSNEQPFTIKIPAAASHKYLRKDGSVGYATYDAPTSDNNPENYLIEVFPPESINAQTCSPSLTGISKRSPLIVTDGEKSWGKVDIGEILRGGDLPFDVTNLLCQEGYPKPAAQYALCSEKKGEVVVICLSQMTDNPEMARQIFETFRWTE